MRWTAGERDNIDDRRASSGRGRMGGAGSIGIGGLLVLLVLSWATGTDLLSLLGGSEALAPADSVGRTAPAQTSAEEERMVDFVNAVARDTQDVWARLLGNRYRHSKVVLFRDATQTGCGFGDAATGPFYCPADQLVYLDLSFFSELSRRFGAPGDFAQAYVIAHEFGHHVQNLLGLNERVGSDRSGPTSAAVALELQADCFAGVWGHQAAQGGRFEVGKVQLDPGDTEEALRAAAAIGDDRLQKMSTGRVAPENFTHGSSAQRVEWFRRGMQSGDAKRCDAFAAITQ